MKLSKIFFTILISLSTIVNAQNYSLNFDGIDDYVEIPFSNIFNVETNFTIEAFVKIKSQSFFHNCIVSKCPNDGWGSGWELAYAEYNGDNFAFTGSPGGINTTVAYHNPLQEKWYHIAGVYDGTKFTFYLDGMITENGIVYVTGPIAPNTLPIVLGRRSDLGGNTHFLNGFIESVKYSNIARYNTPFTPPTKFTNDLNTIGLWNIDEGSGTIIYDESGNGNNGVIYGATWSTDAPIDSLPHLYLQSPNGGESWLIGQHQNITWSSNLVENIKIEYSSDNGNTWLEIVNNIPAITGSYLWTLPNESVQQCKVKITDVLDANVFDISNSSFQITNNTGLVAYYPFNGNANDESGNGYNGIIYGATLTTDRFNKPNSAYLFDGINDYIELESTENLNFTNGSFTLAAWVNYTENKEMAILVKHTYQDIKGYGLHIYPPPKLGFFLHMDPANGISTPMAYNDGAWHFVVGTYANSIMKLYVDGQFVGSLNRTYNQFNNVALRIGKFTSNPDPQFCFKGKIDDIRIFNRELTANEILNLYQTNINIQTESIWKDTDYNGYETRQVSGEGPNIGQGTIIKYDWYVNGKYVDSVFSPTITLKTGTNVLKLVITNEFGTTAADSTEVTVYCSKTQTNGAIYSGISEYDGKLFLTSVDKGVYRIDSTLMLKLKSYF